MLDDRDRKLTLIQGDAEASVTDLAERVALSVSGCSRRLARLREAGFSVRQSAEMATSALQTAIMLVGSEPGSERGVPDDEVSEHLDAKRAALNLLPAERYPYLREAADDMLHCEDPEAYYRTGIALFVEGSRAMLQLADA